MKLRSLTVLVSIPKPPAMTEKNDLFIALHIIYERIAPELPIKAPLMINSLLSSMNPLAEVAQPE